MEETPAVEAKVSLGLPSVATKRRGGRPRKHPVTGSLATAKVSKPMLEVKAVFVDKATGRSYRLPEKFFEVSKKEFRDKRAILPDILIDLPQGFRQQIRQRWLNKETCAGRSLRDWTPTTRPFLSQAGFTKEELDTMNFNAQGHLEVREMIHGWMPMGKALERRKQRQDAGNAAHQRRVEATPAEVKKASGAKGIAAELVESGPGEPEVLKLRPEEGAS